MKGRLNDRFSIINPYGLKERMMKTKEEILNEFGCPDIPFDENVTMYYPAILSAMEEYGKYCAEIAFDDGFNSGFIDSYRPNFDEWWANFQKKEEAE